jgi:threonine/homoserine/homoserine lactone efflux protein
MTVLDFMRTQMFALIPVVDEFKFRHAVLFGGLVGLVSGFLLSIPVGPVNLTIMNEGARRGFKWALLIGLGATAMELVYCFIAFTGLSSFFQRGYVKAAMELVSFVFLLFLGIKFLLVKSVHAPPVELGPAAEKIPESLEERLHPHSAFTIGFVRVMGNIGVLVFWVICASNFISREWVQPDWPGKLTCVGGVALGTFLWFFALSFAASRGYGRFSEKTLLRMEHFSGVCLLIMAFIHGGTIIYEMVQQYPLRH